MAEADLDSKFAAAEHAKKKAEASLRNATDRSYIAKLIVWFFAGQVAVITICVPVGIYFFDWSDIAEPAKYLASILSSVMLPVVTLVIGYYFGKES